MEIVIRKYEEKDLCAMIEIWNEIVEEGNAFPQEEFLTLESGTIFFAAFSPECHLLPIFLPTI